mgnify:CR=1 FL=1
MVILTLLVPKKLTKLMLHRFRFHLKLISLPYGTHLSYVKLTWLINVKANAIDLFQYELKLSP